MKKYILSLLAFASSCVFAKTYYEILGVPQNATPQEIENAHSKKMEEFIEKGGTHRKFRTTNKAYRVLIDPQRKAQYDLKLLPPPPKPQSPKPQSPPRGGIKKQIFRKEIIDAFNRIIRDLDLLTPNETQFLYNKIDLYITQHGLLDSELESIQKTVQIILKLQTNRPLNINEQRFLQSNPEKNHLVIKMQEAIAIENAIKELSTQE